MKYVVNRFKRKALTIEQQLAERLEARHLAELRASGIGDKVIFARGYRTVTQVEELLDLGFPAFQCVVPGYLLPLHHVPGATETDGKLPAPATFKPDTPRRKSEDKPMKYETPSGFRVCLDIPPGVERVLQDTSVPLCVTEGIKKCDAAWSRGLATIGLLGTYCWNVEDWKAISLSHRRVYICFDSDVAVKKEVAHAMKQLTHFLLSRGATVVRLFIPSEGTDKVGLDDYLMQGHTVEDLLQCTKRARINSEIREDLSTIETQKHDLETMVEQSLAALIDENEPPVLFSSLGRLVRIRIDEIGAGKLPRLEAMSKDAIIDRLSQVANFLTTNRDGRRPTNPPDVVARMIVARNSWPGIPMIRRVVSGPVYTEAGEFCGRPGYNSDGQLFVSMSQPIEVPSRVTRKHVRDALTDLYNVVQDFPFADDASKAHWIAFTLLPFVRDMVRGPTPLHLFSAPKAGTGKTKLMAAGAMIFSLEAGFLENAPETEDEWRKRLTSSFMEGSSHVLLDDVKSLKSNALQSALSNPRGLWKDRQLSKNENIRAEIVVVFGASANNLTAKPELLRRCVEIRVDAEMERPELRSGFHVPNLEAYVETHRIELMTACSMIVQYWIDKDCPPYAGPNNLGGFESWVRVMGGILDANGVSGFLDNQGHLMDQADDESASFAGFFHDWHKRHGSAWVGARDVLPYAQRHFEEFETGLAANSAGVKIGRFLSKHRDAVHGGLTLKMKPAHDGNRFRLVKVEG